MRRRGVPTRHTKYEGGQINIGEVGTREMVSQSIQGYQRQPATGHFYAQIYAQA